MSDDAFTVGSSRSCLCTLTVLFYLVAGARPDDKCTLCPNGDFLALPEKQLNIGWPSIQDCKTLDAYSSSLDMKSEECSNVQALSTICGCPIAENSCTLCPDGSNITEHDKQLVFLADSFGGIPPTCELFDAYVHSLDVRDQRCEDAQLVSSQCGCSIVATSHSDEKCRLCPNGEQMALPEKDINIGWPGIENCATLDAYARSVDFHSEECSFLQNISTICGCPIAENSCTFCSDGSNITEHDKPLMFLLNIFGGVPPTCELVDAYVHSVDANTEECRFFRQSISSLCGCPVASDSCSFCNGEPVPNPQKQLAQLEEEFAGFEVGAPTCEQLEAFFRYMESGSADCRHMQDFSIPCGCSPNESNERRQAVLTWLPRSSALLSLCGSLYIIHDIYKKPNSFQKTHFTLLFLLSCVDCLSSIAWGFSTLPIPATDENGDPTNYFEARGNDATCTAQGFFIQLGLTSPFYNLAMAINHLLAIVYERNGTWMKKLRWWLYFVPPLFGLGLALGAIPLYGPLEAMCYVAGPNRNRLLFLGLPLMVVTVFATLIMFKIYLKVTNQQQRSQRWAMTSNAQSLSRKVFWKAFWYLMCFYASWPIVVVVAIMNKGVGLYERFGLMCVAVLLMPLQGFLNFVNYSRLRMLRNVPTTDCFSWKALGRSRTASLEPDLELSGSDESTAATKVAPTVEQNAKG